MKKRLSFRTQAVIGLAVLALCAVLSALRHSGIYQNLGWILCGLMFLINPVWPEMWDKFDHGKLRTGARLAGVLMAVLGVLVRFGGY